MNADEQRGNRGLTQRNADTAGYREYAPHAALRAYVECFWAAVPAAATLSSARRILPDGCVDIIVECDGTSREIAVVGTMTRALVVETSPCTCFVGVRFRPGVAGAMLGVPARELTDSSVPLAELWCETEAATEGIVTASSVVQRLRAMERMLLQRVPRMPALTSEVLAAARMILRADGNLTVAALGPALGVTRQHLTRSFARDVGISPKMLARVVRARAAIARMRHGIELEGSTLALELGYYDQSHLGHDVKELTGLTPGQWAAAR